MENNKILTAFEMLTPAYNEPYGLDSSKVPQIAINFAKMHLEEFKKELIKFGCKDCFSELLTMEDLNDIYSSENIK